MNKILFLLAILFVSCNSGVKPEDKNENKTVSESTDTTVDKKWKADALTKKYVARMAEVVDDSTLAVSAKRIELSKKLQVHVDSLIKYCTMKGPEHDALHGWLEGVLDKMKELKEEDDEFNAVHADLKKNIGKFFELFE